MPQVSGFRQTSMAPPNPMWQWPTHGRHQSVRRLWVGSWGPILLCAEQVLSYWTLSVLSSSENLWVFLRAISKKGWGKGFDSESEFWIDSIGWVKILTWRIWLTPPVWDSCSRFRYVESDNVFGIHAKFGVMWHIGFLAIRDKQLLTSVLGFLLGTFIKR